MLVLEPASHAPVSVMEKEDGNKDENCMMWSGADVSWVICSGFGKATEVWRCHGQSRVF